MALYLYGIANAIFKGILTLNVTNLFRNKDTKSHKRYHTGKKLIAGVDENAYAKLNIVKVHNLDIPNISRLVNRFALT